MDDIELKKLSKIRENINRTLLNYYLDNPLLPCEIDELLYKIKKDLDKLALPCVYNQSTEKYVKKEVSNG